MRSATETIEAVLRTDVLLRSLLTVPEAGASEEQIRAAEAALGRGLSRQHRDLLSRWNGLNLEVVRFFGCDPVPPGVASMLKRRELHGLPNDEVPIGDDPSGFLYVEEAGGEVSSLDSEGGTRTRLAGDLDDFVSRVVFGRAAQEFGGEDWLEDLAAAGLLEDSPSS